MRNMSAQGRATMAKRRDFVNYAYMTLADGTVLNLQPKDFRISGNTFTDDLVSGDSFEVGTAIGKTVNMRLDNTDERFSQYDFYMARFVLYVHLPEAYTDSQEQLQDEIFTIGLFTVTEPTTTGVVIDIAGIDEMYKFDKSFDACNLDFSTGPTLYQILAKCCNDCGVTIGFSTFDNSTMTVTNRPEGVTYREVVSYVCQMAGMNARISPTGALTLVWYDMSVLTEGLDGGTFSNPGSTSYQDGDTADGGSFNPWDTGYVFDGGSFDSPVGFHQLSQVKGLTVSTDDIQITGVRVTYEDTSVIAGNDTYVIEIKDNPFTVGKESVIATFLYNKLTSLVFRPFSCSYLQDPTIEAGDAALVWDIKGNSYKTIITNVTYNTNGMMSIASKAQSPAKQQSSFKNVAARAVVEARRNTEKQIDTYTQTVDHFNEIANNALGYYKTETTEQGATITYYHDAPTLSASTNIIKITGSGIFISDDGGQSYSSGYETSTATMLLNLVYAHGITADWVTSGLFQDKQGKFVLDIDNSTLKLDLNSQVGTGSSATTLGGMLTRISATESGLSSEVTRATTAEGELSSVYSGSYVPTASNSPASAWTTTALKEKHENDVFYNNTTGNSYQWKNATGGVLITFDSRSETESTSYDWVEIYYYDSSISKYRKTIKYGGRESSNNIANTQVFIPSSTFYIYFKSDGSYEYWGFAISDVRSATGDDSQFTTTADSLPTSVTSTLYGTSTKPETAHNYSSSQQLLWQWNTQISVTNGWQWVLNQDIQTMQSSITQAASQISAKVSQGDVTAQLNLECNNGNAAIELNTTGKLIITSGNFKVDQYGNINATNAILNGELTNIFTYTTSGVTHSRKLNISTASITTSIDDIERFRLSTYYNSDTYKYHTDIYQSDILTFQPNDEIRLIPNSGGSVYIQCTGGGSLNIRVSNLKINGSNGYTGTINGHNFDNGICID